MATLADALPPEIRAAIDRGWSVIPCGAKKRPLVLWKDYQTRPLTSNELTNWANRNPATWAVVTGTLSGVVVLDFDGEAGAETLARLGLRAHVVTPSGGAHVYCQHPGGAVPTMNSKVHAALGAAWPGTDIRGDGGYACFCGRTDRGAYRIARDFADLAPAEVVTRVLATVREAKVPTSSPSAGNVSGNGTYPEGERHGALVSFAGRCRRAGMDGSEILAALRQFNAAHCQPPKPESELHRIADDIAGRYESGSPEAPDYPWPDPEPLGDALPPVDSYDDDLLPGAFRGLVQDVSDRMQVPPDFPAAVAVLCLAGVVNRRVLIQPKEADSGWVVTPNLWGGDYRAPWLHEIARSCCDHAPTGRNRVRVA